MLSDPLLLLFLHCSDFYQVLQILKLNWILQRSSDVSSGAKFHRLFELHRGSTMRRHIHTHQATHKHTQTNNNAHTNRTRLRDPAGKSPVPASPQCKQNGGNCTRPTRGENVAATMLLTRSTSSGRRLQDAAVLGFASRRRAEPGQVGGALKGSSNPSLSEVTPSW